MSAAAEPAAGNLYYKELLATKNLKKIRRHAESKLERIPDEQVQFKTYDVACWVCLFSLLRVLLSHRRSVFCFPIDGPEARGSVMNKDRIELMN